MVATPSVAEVVHKIGRQKIQTCLVVRIISADRPVNPYTKASFSNVDNNCSSSREDNEKKVRV